MSNKALELRHFRNAVQITIKKKNTVIKVKWHIKWLYTYAIKIIYWGAILVGQEHWIYEVSQIARFKTIYKGY